MHKWARQWGHCDLVFFQVGGEKRDGAVDEDEERSDHEVSQSLRRDHGIGDLSEDRAKLERHCTGQTKARSAFSVHPMKYQNEIRFYLQVDAISTIDSDLRPAAVLTFASAKKLTHKMFIVRH